MLPRLKLIVVFIAAAAGLCHPACGQNGLPAEERINGKLVWQAFEPQREVLQQSSAVIYTGGQTRIKSLYGVVVSEDGHILTKASEVIDRGALAVRLSSELYPDVEILGVNDEWDIAMLKVSSEEKLVPVILSDEDDAKLGHWVVSNGSTTRSQRRVRVGIVSALTRPIKPDSGKVVLGVELGTKEDDRLTIKELAADGGAQKAGLKVGDVLYSVGGAVIEEHKDLVEAMEGKKPGENIAVEVMRDTKKLGFEVELSARPAAEQMMSRNDMMSGGEESLSLRRDDFPRVIHHDTPLTKVSVGGPLLNLDGICIGMNIARADRVATYAIPAKELAVIVEQMTD